jgi:hypothetical protein
MDDEVPGPADAPEADDENPDENPVVALPSLPEEVTTGDEELRQLIEAGASTPEELRALAARIREHRDREAVLWREEVRPGLKKAKKHPFRLGDLVDTREEAPAWNGLKLGAAIVVVMLVLVLAAFQSSMIWVLLPLLAVVVYAVVQARRGDTRD